MQVRYQERNLHPIFHGHQEFRQVNWFTSTFTEVFKELVTTHRNQFGVGFIHVVTRLSFLFKKNMPT